MAGELFDPKIVGETIRDKRKSLGWTQKRLADMVNITPEYMCELECGKHLAGGKLLNKLFLALKLKIVTTVE